MRTKCVYYYISISEFDVEKTQSRLSVHKRLGLPVHSKDSDEDDPPKIALKKEKKSHRRIVREVTPNVEKDFESIQVKKKEMKPDKSVENVSHKRTSSTEDNIKSASRSKRIKIVRTGKPPSTEDIQGL